MADEKENKKQLKNQKKEEKIKQREAKVAKMKLNSEKVRSRELKIKFLRIGLLIMLLFLIIIYFLLRIVYESGNFTISLDKNFSKKNGLVMFENEDNQEDKLILEAQKANFVDNISVKWLPQDIDNQGDGSHNGENYFAYTFYIKNKGSESVNYWYDIAIDDVIRNVDEATRVMVILNGEKTLYAKANNKTGEAEEGTEKFYSTSEVAVKCRENFEPGATDKYTIVLFIEGDDPDCVDALIGGEIKMHMDITEEHVEE